MPTVPPFPTWADVAAIAPELTNIPLASQTAALAGAIEHVNPGSWGDKAFRGIVYLAAHLGTLASNDGVQIASESIGSMSRSYDVSFSGSPGALSGTQYGAEYRRLLKTLPTALGMVL